MYSFTTHWLQLERDRRRLREPERTMCSYVWQEAEGLSRIAKLEWCTRHGHVAHNLQHDGVIIQLGGRRPPTAAAAAADLSAVCTHALGYPQPVEVKDL